MENLLKELGILHEFKRGELIKVRVIEINQTHIKVLTPFPSRIEGLTLRRFLELDPELGELKIGQHEYIEYIGDYKEYPVFAHVVPTSMIMWKTEGNEIDFNYMFGDLAL